MSKIVVGIQKLHYAVLTTDTVSTLAYGVPKKLANAIEVTITPNTSSTTLFADDGPVAVTSGMGEIEVELNVDALDSTVLAEVLGITKNADGVLEFTESASPPYIAIGFRAPLSDNGFRYVWLTKGRFELPEDSYKTKGDQLEFQTPTISAKFVKREHDGMWKYQVDSTDAGVNATAITNWFTAVYDGPAV